MRDLKKSEDFISNIKNDFPASLVVFFVALPLCLGIALASGAPLFSGIIAGIVGGIVVGLASNSTLGVSGPAAGLTVIVLTSIEKLGTFEAFLLAVVLAGIFQIILGLFKAGVIAYYFPSSVIKGMLTAIGVIIILKQIPHTFGYDADYEGDLSFLQADGENSFTEIVRMIDSLSPGAIFISIISIGALLFWESEGTKKHMFFRIVPGPLVAIVMGVLYQIITWEFFPQLSLEQKHLVNVPSSDSVVQFFGKFSFPDFSYFGNQDIWVIAATIAIVASLETLLCVEATDKLDPRKGITDTNRELIAQGFGNLTCGLIGGIPVTQVIVRSSVNIQSGGRTKLSAILHGLLLLICVASIPHILSMIPLAVLASILLLVGFKLVNFKSIKEMYQLGWTQLLPFAATVVGIVLTDLLIGIVIGLVVAITIILRKSLGNSHILHIEDRDGKDHVKIVLAEEVYFMNKGAILDELNRVKDGSHVTIDMSRSINIDHDVLEVINDFKKTAQSKNVVLVVVKNIKTILNTYPVSLPQVLEETH